MSDANRTRVAMVEETALGVTPATPVLRRKRILSSSLTYTPKTVKSNELREDGQTADLVRVGFESGGALPFEVSPGELDTYLEGGLRNAFVARGARAQNAVAGDLLKSVANGALTTDNTVVFAPGDLVLLSGFGVPANNGVFVALAGSAAGLLNATGLVVEAQPPIGARAKRVGIQFAAGVLSATLANGVASLVRSTGSWLTAPEAVVPGEWLRIGQTATATRFATATSNGLVRVKSVTATTLVLDRIPAGFAADAGAAKTVSVFQGDYLRNGTVKKSYTVEQTFLDLTVPEYHRYVGMRVDTLSLQADSQALLTGSVSFKGMSSAIDTDPIQGSSYAAAPTGDVFNTSTTIGRIASNGQKISGPNYVMASTLNIANNLRGNPALGAESSVDVVSGTCDVTGSLNTYYGDQTILQKLRQNQNTSYDVAFIDPNSGDGLLIDLPRIKFSAGDPTVPGINTDRMLPLSFQALADATLGYTINVQRFEGLAS